LLSLLFFSSSRQGREVQGRLLASGLGSTASVEELGAGSSDGVVLQAARRDDRGLGFKARLSAA
jgi:hypothetical protein